MINVIPIDLGGDKTGYIFDITVNVGARPSHLVKEKIEEVADKFKNSDLYIEMQSNKIPFHCFYHTDTLALKDTNKTISDLTSELKELKESVG
jgi:thiamine pyrophosphate-dependent acetolactate synthase large subunit-like protein